MLGAIIGDIAGSAYEFHNTKDYKARLFTEASDFTDDSILTLAVADWLMHDPQHSEEQLVATLVRYGQAYPDPTGSYGGTFSTWLFHPEDLPDFTGAQPYAGSPSGDGQPDGKVLSGDGQPDGKVLSGDGQPDGKVLSGDGREVGERHPYNSWGNGSAMRVAAVGWCFDTLEETERVAALSAAVTHNHPEGIKGAQATAAIIFMARKGAGKDEIREYISSRYCYDLNRSWEELHRNYSWDSSCQGTVPEAIICFLESGDFEDAVRKAVAIGGDSDTLACITGGMAEAFYQRIPDFMLGTALERLPAPLARIFNEFTCFSKAYHEVWMAEGFGRERVTPSHINALRDGEIFVFGSNVRGMHGGGAARYAMDHFGAVWGNGEGLQGQCYALPTMEGIVNMEKAIARFTDYAARHPEYKFLVTPVACGIAGYTPEEVAPFFKKAAELENVCLPEAFWKIIR